MEKHIEILQRLKNNGYEGYIVGGAVRDMLSKKCPTDFDLCTNAKIDELKLIFKNERLVTAGQNFQVLIINDIETATYRKDIHNKDGWSTEVVNTVEDDLGRRDLTINAIAYDPFTDKYIDPYGGREDIKRGKIKFVGNPKERIIEDPVRMLRACRFLTTIKHSQFDINTFKAIEKYSYLIQNVPMERIGTEVIKAMKTIEPGRFFQALNNVGILQYVFPNMMPTVGLDGGKFHNETVFDHCVNVCNNIKMNVPIFKLAGFLHDIGKPLAHKLNSNGTFRGHEKVGQDLAYEDLKRLKFSNNNIEFITNMISLHMLNIKLDSEPKTIRKALAKLRKTKITHYHLIDHIIADHDGNMKNEPHDESVRIILNEKFLDEINGNNKFSINDLEISGNDIIAILNIKPGKLIGMIKNELFKMVIDEPELNKRSTLITIVKEKYRV